ncbi:MAG: MFS transporter, partial [Rhodospirillaceae bacterium]|nr:MFS transporter [Rhodospirillaceae bacterium]
DRYDRRSTMLGLICCAMGFALLIVVFGAWSLPLLTILSFAFGDMMGPIYGLSVAQTNDYVEKDQFVAVSSGLLIAYSLGAIAGPNIASWLMNGVGPIGLWLYVAVILLGLGGYTVYRVRRHTALPVKEQGNYVAVAGETPLAGELDPRAPTLASQAQNGHQTPPAGPNMAPMGPKADRNRTM